MAQVTQDCNYGGWQVALPPGDYLRSQLEARGIRNDDASAIRVADGYEAILYEHDNFGGATRRITGDASCLVNQNFNDAVSSVKVRKIPVPPTAVLYDDCGLGGIEAALPVGNYTASQLAAAGITNNALSSLFVPPGLRVVAYDGDNFTGASRTLTGVTECLVDQGFNDVASLPVAFAQKPTVCERRRERLPGSTKGDAESASTQASSHELWLLRRLAVRSHCSRRAGSTEGLSRHRALSR